MDIEGYSDNYRTGSAQDNIITQETLAGLRDGDSECFRKIYLRWRKPVRKFVFDMIGSTTDADDLTQDIFSMLWEYREKVYTEINIQSLLFLMGKRAAAKSRAVQQVREKYETSVWFTEQDRLSVSPELVDKMEAELLKTALLQRMPPQQRQVFMMAHEQDMTTDEIAEKLGIKRKTACTKLSRARKEIRDAILLVALWALSNAPRYVIASIFS